MNIEQEPSDNIEQFSLPQFISGFVGWFAVNMIIVVAFASWFNNQMANNVQVTGVEFVFLCVISLINIVSWLFLFVKSRPAALGAFLAFIVALMALFAIST